MEARSNDEAFDSKVEPERQVGFFPNGEPRIPEVWTSPNPDLIYPCWLLPTVQNDPGIFYDCSSILSTQVPDSVLERRPRKGVPRQKPSLRNISPQNQGKRKPILTWSSGWAREGRGRPQAGTNALPVSLPLGRHRSSDSCCLRFVRRRHGALVTESEVPWSQTGSQFASGP